MATSYKTPGVYVQEITTLPASIAAVPTAIPGIVGHTEKSALVDGTDVSDKPVRITSMLEFEQIFGGPFKQVFDVNITGTVAAPSIVVTPEFDNDPSLAPYILYYQMQMFYANGGGTCYVVSVGKYTNSIAAGTLTAGLGQLEKIDEITLVNIPEIVKLDTPDRKTLNDAMLAHCAKMENRFALLDVLQDSTSIETDASGFRDNEVSIDNLKYGGSYYPGLTTTLQHFYEDAGVKITTTITEWSNYTTLELAKTGDTEDPPTFPPNTTLYNLVTAELKKFSVELYPSSSMAGVYARVDNTRGVWKAPANVGLRNVKAPSVLITDSEQENLNIDSASGKSINAIRNFEGRGLLVWGARTLDGNSNEWRYINVRRLFLFVEQSTKNASQFVVFEPNTPLTWSRVKGMISNFLTDLWRDGGLVGATTEEAYFVKVGLGETMTTQDVLEGRMIVEIGLAASRPAEFIVLRFSHFINQE
jgi:phage tail sheath protein FI